MFDKRYKCFIAGMFVGAVTWSVSLYLYWGVSSEPSSKQLKSSTSISKSDPVILPYEEGFNLKKGKERYLPKYSNQMKPDDIARQNLNSIMINTDNKFDDPGLVKNLQDLKFRDEGYRMHGFNSLVSRNLDYHRPIPDTRHQLCKNQTYKEDLPSASIVICFFNEQFDTLARSLHSIVDRTPPKLLYEIVLVDDFSDIKGLHDAIANYIDSKSLDKVKLLRTTKREGLIRARIFGADRASGEVLVFLDSHIEVNVGWLEPLLARIEEDSTRIVTPIIDIVNSDTFDYTSSPLVRGGFNWGLHFKWINVPAKSLAQEEDFIKPIASPTMAGGLFAVFKKYFNAMGKYDAGMNIWGGENIEISFRTWQCGGSIEIVPCSRIGHVFRKHRPYGSPDGEDTMLRNSLRVANVWMDEYKEKFYEQRPESNRVDFGDISSRLELKKAHNCKSFEWYLQHVYPELLQPGEGGEAAMLLSETGKKRKKYLGTYQIRLSGTGFCISSEKDVKTKGSKLILRPCLRVKNQLWFKTDKGELKLAQYLCMDVQHDEPVLGKCHEMGGTQEWKHSLSNMMAVYNLAAGTCLSALQPQVNSRVMLSICTANHRSQWDFVPISS